MQPSILKNLYLVVEGQFDAQVIRTVLNCNDYKNVYCSVTDGVHNMPSICRTLRLMLNPEDRMLIVFDSDTLNPDDINDKLVNMRFLTKADVSNIKMGVFCMVPDLEHCLGLPEKKQQAVSDYLKRNLNEIKKLKVINDMQAFIDD